MGIDLPLLWAAIIAFGVMMYVVMDGFDLGIGILFPLIPAKDDRDLMMNTVAPVWDGNETWLVLGGAGLLAAFPLAYSLILSAFYLPIVLMLCGLIFRGVAFEFRFKADASHRPIWDRAFIGGSWVATYFQGVTLGGFIQGIPVRDGRYAGSALDWITPFALLAGAGLIATYALLGSAWLIMKTEGELQARMRELTRRLGWAVLAAIVAVSVWTPLAQPAIAERWFSWPNLLWFSPVPLLVGLAIFALQRSVRHAVGGGLSDAPREASDNAGGTNGTAAGSASGGRPRARGDAAPFLLTLALVFLGYSGLCISLWPHIVPPAITLRQAAGPPESLGFALVGALLIIPLILMYTAWSYWVFRGKVRSGEGYH